MQSISLKWLRIALINLNIIALIGTLLRYKIAFSFPFIDQKHLLEGHSHFAFAGWVTQALMILMVDYLYKQGLENSFKKYAWVLLLNLICAYGMLITFPLGGYGTLSIFFSTSTIFVSYIFAFLFWLDLNRLKKHHLISYFWFKAALIFKVISSLGALCLAYMMANKIVHQSWHLGSVYFFLHFQYNGWFFFACMGLLMYKFTFLHLSTTLTKTVFWGFAFSCIPAYLLSVLWLPLPAWVYIFIVISAFVQLSVWFILAKNILTKTSLLIKEISFAGRCLLTLSGIAFTIKLLLQLGSTYPPLSKLAFGFRPIVIGYLHLVLLGVTTLFIIGYMVSSNLLLLNRQFKMGISIFSAGILLNEILLMIQGAAGIKYISIPYINELLLGAAVLMFAGTFLIVMSQFNTKLKSPI